MENIISKFQGKYPRVVEYILNMNKDYPLKLQMQIVISLSILMSNFDSGHYNKYLKDGHKINNEIIDMFGKTYLQNYFRVADTVYMTLGSYEPFPKTNILNPDKFVEKLINHCNL
jgi:hypothetical protein